MSCSGGVSAAGREWRTHGTDHRFAEKRLAVRPVCSTLLSASVQCSQCVVSFSLFCSSILIVSQVHPERCCWRRTVVRPSAPKPSPLPRSFVCLPSVASPTSVSMVGYPSSSTCVAHIGAAGSGAPARPGPIGRPGCACPGCNVRRCVRSSGGRTGTEPPGERRYCHSLSFRSFVFSVQTCDRGCSDAAD
jgi:hypothetical protein